MYVLQLRLYYFTRQSGSESYSSQEFRKVSSDISKQLKAADLARWITETSLRHFFLCLTSSSWFLLTSECIVLQTIHSMTQVTAAPVCRISQRGLLFNPFLTQDVVVLANVRKTQPAEMKNTSQLYFASSPLTRLQLIKIQ